MQLEGHDDQPVQDLIQAGVLEQPLCSPDWLQTAETLESLDLLVSVDTSVAHLAGALGVPTVLMLNAPADWRWGQVSHQDFSLRCNDSGALCCSRRLVASSPASGSEVNDWFARRPGRLIGQHDLPHTYNMTGMKRYSGEHLGSAFRTYRCDSSSLQSRTVC